MALEQPQPQPQSQSKRKRRPSVRLGEIGELGFTASRLESKRKQSVLEVEWSVVEPAVATATSPVVDGAPTGKRRSSGAPRLRWAGGRFQENDAATRSERPARDDREEPPVWLAGSCSKEEHPENGASEEANPNFHGAIEDDPHGRGVERRSVRTIVRRKHRTPSRDASVAGGFVANGTVIITPSSSQGLALSAGVTGWLQELGLGKYADFFEFNEVDTEVLPLLTMDDLREMGIDAVGARRKMFSNIQALRRN